MSELDDILVERGKYSAGVERQDVTLHGLTVKEANHQIKKLVLKLIAIELGKVMSPRMFTKPDYTDGIAQGKIEALTGLQHKINEL